MLARWRESFVEAADGTRLYVRERDGKPPLTAILCDGIACDGFIWRYLAEDLTSVARVLHWNYRGHGRSGAPVDPDRIDLPALIDDLQRVRQSRIGDGPTVLIGHSMGVQIALEGYRNRPEQVAGLVLVCGTAGRMTHTFKGSDALAQALPRLIERVRDHPQIARALWSNFPPEMATRIALATGEVAATIRPEDLTAYTEHVANLDLLMFLRMLRAVGDETAADLLPEVAAPVLVIAGELDGFTPPHLAEEMAATLPNSELMMVPGATHVVPIERREEVRDRIYAFVRERAALWCH